MMVAVVGSNPLNGSPCNYAVELRTVHQIAMIQCETEEEAHSLKSNIREWLKTNKGQTPEQVAAHWQE